MINLLEGLNDAQSDAVQHIEGPLLILAGAGSGKTRVITNRAAFMIQEKDIDPRSIMAITFTNKAANEMKERIGKLLGDRASDMWVGTFHAICVRILRRDIEKLGYSRSFAIYDTSDQQTIVKDCLKQLNFNESNFSPRDVLSAIGRAKDQLQEPADYMKMYGSDFRFKKLASIYELYQNKLKSNNALDFDDIILLTVKLLKNNPPVLQHYQNRFKYLLVDEYQDTNKAQYTLISMLAKNSSNLCVVGDDDQSIYGWRGADIRNILDFEKEFPGCKVVKLEQNYRSTGSILDAANHIIKNNAGRKAKSLWTDKPQGSPVNVRKCSNEQEECSFVSGEIRRRVRSEDLKYSDFAVLYRINAQSRVLEETLMKDGVPYKIYGGQKFYERKEIKDTLAYLKLILNPSDNVALKRIINVPRRGIGATTVAAIEEAAQKLGISAFEAVGRAYEIPELARTALKLEEFAKLINFLRDFSVDNEASAIIGEVIERSGIQAELEKEESSEAETRLENIRELISGAMEFEKILEAEIQEQDFPRVGSLEEYLANVSLVADIDSFDEEKDYVSLMTVHSSKGLEFPNVFIVGMEDNIFPGQRAIDSDNGLEEERRLCYVGMTRARENLYLSCAASRTLFGKTSFNPMSKFLGELPKEVNIEESSPRRKQTSAKQTAEYVGSGFGARTVDTNWAGKPAQDVPSEQLNYVVGDKVVHSKFGVGTISAIEPEDGDFMVEIQFKTSGMKRLMAAYAKLLKL